MELPRFLNTPIAVDTETTGLYPDQGARITTVSVATAGFEKVWDIRQMSGADYYQLLGWLGQQKLIFQNAKFDMGMFLRGSPFSHITRDFEPVFFWDTKEATGLLWPVGPWKLNEKNHKKEYSTGLKPVTEWLWGPQATAAEKRLKEYLSAQPKKLQKRYDLVPKEILEPYALQDAKLTYRLYSYQVAQGTLNPYEPAGYESKWRKLMSRELAFERVLYGMETRGIGFDAERGRAIATQLQSKLAHMEADLPVRPTRDQMVKYWWEDHDGAPDWLPRTEKQEKVKLDEYHLWKLTQLKYPFAQMFYDYEQIKSAVSKWYSKWPNKVGPDGRLRVDYRQNGAMTGRLSGADVTLQGVPQDFSLSKEVPSVRRLFIPKPKHRLWGIDLSQAELRIATSVAKCKLARQYLESGKDMHGETAKTIFRVAEGDRDWKKHRYIAKTTNFAVLYTAGPDTLVEQITHEGKIDFTKRQAMEARAAHRELYPEYYWETDKAASVAKERGYIKTVSGRRIYWQPWEHRFYKAFNNVIQGNVAECMKDIMIWIDKTYPGILLLQIHDEVVLEVPEDDPLLVSEIANYMEQYTSELFHIKMIAEVKPWGINAYEEAVAA